MKIISWNVNGIRAVLKKGFLDFLNDYNPDIICIQETKASPEQVELELEKYPYKYWNSAEKKGYSGTAIFSKINPLSIKNDLAIEKHDQEGRVISTGESITSGDYVAVSDNNISSDEIGKTSAEIENLEEVGEIQEVSNESPSWFDVSEDES